MADYQIPARLIVDLADVHVQSTEPSTRENGDALADGDLWLDLSNDVWKVYDTSVPEWATVGSSGGGSVAVDDDGTEVVASASRINFGTDLSVTDDGSGAVTVDSTASGGGGGGALTLIDDQVLASAAANITFSSIAGTYTDLLLMLQLRSDRAGEPNDDVVIYVGNGSVDSGSNYRQNLNYQGASNGSVRSAARAGWRLTVGAAGAAADSGVRGIAEVKILDYASTGQWRSATGRGSVYNTSSLYWEWRLGIGDWKNDTDAIDIIQIVSANSADWASGSRAVLYGLG